MQPILVYTYRDTAQFQQAAIHMAQGGYYPVSQAWSQGQTQRNPILLILGLVGLLFFIIPGVIILIIWAAYSKTGPGLLTVTYQLQAGREPIAQRPRPQTFDEWVRETGVRNAREIIRRQLNAGQIDKAKYDEGQALIDGMNLD